MPAGVVIVGTRQAQANFTKIGQQAPQVVADVLRTEAEVTMTLAKSLCPVDTGNLRASGRVESPQVAAHRITIEMGFHTDYAIYVHENLGAHHAVGQAKFLEVAVNRRRPTIEANLGRALRAALGGGVK